MAAANNGYHVDPDRRDSESRSWRELSQQYYILTFLGHGSRGNCYLVAPRQEYNERRAAGGGAHMDVSDLIQVAKMRRSVALQNNFRREIRNLQTPLLRMLGSRDRAVKLLNHDKARFAWLVMSYEGPSLLDIFRQMRPQHTIFPVELAWSMFAYLTLTLALCHDGPEMLGHPYERMVHRDILECNIAIRKRGNEVFPVLIDWGSAVSDRQPEPEKNPLWSYPTPHMRVNDRMELVAVFHRVLHEVNDEIAECRCNQAELSRLLHPDMDEVLRFIETMARTCQDERTPTNHHEYRPRHTTQQIFDAITMPDVSGEDVWGRENMPDFGTRTDLTPGLEAFYANSTDRVRVARARLRRQFRRDRREAREVPRRQTRRGWAVRGRRPEDLNPGL